MKLHRDPGERLMSRISELILDIKDFPLNS